MEELLVKCDQTAQLHDSLTMFMTLFALKLFHR